MATKAEKFKAEQERLRKPPKPKAPPKRRRVAADAAGGEHTAGRHPSEHAKEKDGARLEDSATGKPSRKSTRKTQGRVKTTSNLQRRATRKTTSPESRAARAKARAKKA